MARLSLALLGALEVRLDGQAVTAGAYDKVWALLAYLAVEADHPHRRDTLIGLLWPDQPDQAARTNLRQALTQLRQAIGDHTAQPPFLLIARETIQLNPAADCSLDVAHVTALLDACDRHPHRHPETCKTCARRRTEATKLYRGDFLEEFFLADAASFEEWALLKREALHERMRAALAHLAAYHERLQAYEPARRCAQRQIELDPWSESAHRQVMRVLATIGRRSDALRQYGTCRRLLAEGLGVEPEAETTALYEQIKRGYTLARCYVERPPTNLHEHTPTNVFIGRKAELAMIADWLEQRDCRLLTLVGLGGIGKTRLALQAAHAHRDSFYDGVIFVPLAPLRSAEFLLPAIVDALKLSLQGSESLQSQLLAYLHTKDLLLVLDNFEHLLEAAGVLSDIIQRAPAVTLLVTSRERLNLSCEWVLDISGMPVPTSSTVAEATSASVIQLFVRTAGRVRSEFILSAEIFPSVLQICQLVAGMPLAIEIAASWIWALTPAEIIRALETDGPGLTTTLRDLPPRHRSIRTLFDHSWHLLEPDVQRTLAAVSVFRGGFTLDAAAQIASASMPLLSGLVSKSLLRRDATGRYDLHELVRQYAAEQLHLAGEVDAIERKHALYFLALAETIKSKTLDACRNDWLEQLDRDYDNIRTALAWSQTPTAGTEVCWQFIGALWKFWFMGYHMTEGYDWFVKAFPTRSAVSLAVRARALSGASILLWRTGAPRLREQVAAEGLAFARELDDRQSMALALASLGSEPHDRQSMALALASLGSEPQEDRIRRAALLEESLHLFQQMNNRWGQAFVCIRLGENLRLQEKPDQAILRIEQGQALFHSIADELGVSDALTGLGYIALARGEHLQAARRFEASLTIKLHVGERQAIASSHWDLGMAAYASGDYARAHEWYSQALIFFHRMGYATHTVRLLELLASVAAVQAQPRRAAQLLGAAEVLREASGYGVEAANRPAYDCTVAAARAQLDEAVFAAAWAAGRRMTVDRAITEAVDTAPQPRSEPLSLSAEAS